MRKDVMHWKTLQEISLNKFEKFTKIMTLTIHLSRCFITKDDHNIRITKVQWRVTYNHEDDINSRREDERPARP